MTNKESPTLLELEPGRLIVNPSLDIKRIERAGENTIVTFSDGSRTTYADGELKLWRAFYRMAQQVPGDWIAEVNKRMRAAMVPHEHSQQIELEALDVTTLTDKARTYAPGPVLNPRLTRGVEGDYFNLHSEHESCGYGGCLDATQVTIDDSRIEEGTRHRMKELGIGLPAEDKHR